jgi:hypothetical protein
MSQKISQRSIDNLNYFPWAVTQISFILLCTAIATLLVGINSLKPMIKNDLSYYKCKPYIAPFISIIDENINVADNFQKCVSKMLKPIIKKNADKTLTPLLDETTKHGLSASVEAVKNEELVDKRVTRNKMNLSNFFELFNNFRMLVTYASIKVQHIFFKIGSLIIIWYYFLVTQINMIFVQIASMYNFIAFLLFFSAVFASNIVTLPVSIILAAIAASLKISDEVAAKKAFCCFSKNSLVRLESGDLKKIKDINIHESLGFDSVVLGKIEVLNIFNENLVSVNPHVQVTPEHLMFNRTCNEWQPSGEFGCPSTTTKPSHLYCLVTSNNLIPLYDNVLCTDYEESHCNYIQSKTSYYTLSSLNPSINNMTHIKPKYEIGEGANCLDGKTLVRCLKNGASYYKNIKDVALGEYIEHDNKVIGKFHCAVNKSFWFNMINDDVKNVQVEVVQMSPRLIINHDILTMGKWDKVYNSNFFVPKDDEILHIEKDNLKSEVGYHLITEKNAFTIKLSTFDVRVRDFVECSDENAQQSIDKEILNYLNKA